MSALIKGGPSASRRQNLCSCRLEYALQRKYDEFEQATMSTGGSAARETPGLKVPQGYKTQTLNQAYIKSDILEEWINKRIDDFGERWDCVVR